MSEKVYERSFVSASALWDELSPTKAILSVSENHNEFYYRGHASADWKLLPSVLRDDPGAPVHRFWTSSNNIRIVHQMLMEARLISSFIEGCHASGTPLPGHWDILNDPFLSQAEMTDGQCGKGDWLEARWLPLVAFAQHHGVPTRLLDWSYSPYVALYFAASGAKTRMQLGDIAPGGEMALWRLGPVVISRKRALTSVIDVIEVPGYLSPHIPAQRGVFTLQKYCGVQDSLNRFGLEELVSDSQLHKYTLPYSEVDRVLELCSHAGISAATLYPGADGAGKRVHAELLRWEPKIAQ